LARKIFFLKKLNIKIENFSFGQKSRSQKILKISLLATNFVFFDKNLWSKISLKIMAQSKNQNFGQKSKFWSKIEILVKNLSQKSKFWSKTEI